MEKTDWKWVPVAILCFFGIGVMASPIIIPMDDMTKFMVMMPGFGIFLLALFGKDVVRLFRFMRSWIIKRFKLFRQAFGPIGTPITIALFAILIVGLIYALVAQQWMAALIIFCVTVLIGSIVRDITKVYHNNP
jgi:L-asparagine transporter-like permease